MFGKTSPPGDLTHHNLRGFCLFMCVSAQNFVLHNEFVKRFFVAFGAIVLVASAVSRSWRTAWPWARKLPNECQQASLILALLHECIK